MANKILSSGKPEYLSSQFIKPPDSVTRTKTFLEPPNYKLNVSREGFIYRSVALMNQLPPRIRNETSKSVFKQEVRSWVSSNIPAKP